LEAFPYVPHEGGVGGVFFKLKNGIITGGISGLFLDYLVQLLLDLAFTKLYEKHIRTLKLQDKAKKTIDAYSRATRRSGIILIATRTDSIRSS